MSSLAPNTAKTNYDTGADLEIKVIETRKRLRLLWLIAGLAFWEVATIGSLLLMVGVDMLVPLPVWMRIVFCIVFWLILLSTLVAGIVWPLWHPPSLWAVAQRMEQTIEQMHNRLLSVLDLRQRESHEQLSQRAFFIRLLDQTRQRMEHFDIEKVVSTIRMRHALATAVGMWVLLIILILLFTPSFPTAAGRILVPTADIPPATWVRFDTVGDMDVLQGEPVTLMANLTRGELETVTLRLRQDDGTWHQYPMTMLSPTQFAFRIERLDETHQYQFVGGGTWTRVHNIKAVRRPVVSDVAMTLTLPDYTRHTEARLISEDQTQVDALSGSRLNCLVTVEGDVASGRAVFYDLLTTKSTSVTQEHRVWVEDAFPTDARILGDVRWRPNRSNSGSHSFVVKGTDAAGFVTNLNTFTVAPDAALTLSVYIPKGSPPKSMTISFNVQDQWRKLVLVEDAAYESMGDNRDRQFFAIGRLPELGQWVQISIEPSALMRSEIKEPITLKGMTVQLDQGHVYVDRVGSLRSQTLDVIQTEMHETGSQPLDPVSGTNQWQGSLPINHDYHLRFEFKNKLGYANQPGQPIRVVAIEDAAPSILIERPGQNVTVQKSENVVVIARGFDDFGIASVGLRTGRAKSKLDKVHNLEKISGIATTHLIMTTLDKHTNQLQPGDVLYYQLMLTDTQGQTTASEIQRLRIAAEVDDRPQAWEKQTTALDRALRTLSQMLENSPEMLDAPAKLLEEMFKQSNTPTDRLMQITKVDGSPLTAEELQALLDQKVDQLDEQRQQEIRDAERQLKEQQTAMRKAAEQLKDALQLEADSAMSTPISTQSLAEMQQVMQDMIQQQAQVQTDQKLTVEELQAMQQMSSDQPRLSAMQQKISQLLNVREQMAKNPQQAQQQMQQLMAQMQAQRAQRDMQQLNDVIQKNQKNLKHLSDQQQQLLKQTRQAQTSQQLAQASQQQRQLDPETIEAVEQAQRLLDAMIQQRQQRDALAQLAPWQPPGDLKETMPVEQDTVEAENDSLDEDKLKEQLKDKIAELEQDMNWWEQPINAPPETQTLEASERFADRQREVEIPESNEAELSPRQMLEKHQQDMQQALTQNSEAMQKQLAEIAALQQKLEAIQSQLDTKQTSRSKSRTRNGEVDSRQSSKRTPQPSESESPNNPQQAMEQLAELMQSSQMNKAKSMSQRAMAMLRAQSNREQAQQGVDGQGDSTQPNEMIEPGLLISVDLPDLSPDQKMKLYRLPPSMRQPLMQGMKQRGPEGYQPLIDAYYRELTQEQQ